MLAIAHLLFILLPPVLASLHLGLSRGWPDRRRAVECFLVYHLVIGVGVQGVSAGLKQVWDGEAVAAYVGWSYSPFVREVGFSNLAFGVLGLLAPWCRGSWRDAAGVGYSVFLLLAAGGHLRSLLDDGNLSIGNAGPTLWSDLYLPAVILGLLVLRRRLGRFE